MDINEIIRAKKDFNTFLFSMSFPEIVKYIEKNPSQIPNVDWELFTNPSVRISKNIDSFPELILKHPEWYWKFDMKQIQKEISRKISELNRLTEKTNFTKPTNENWLDKLIFFMEQYYELQKEKKKIETEIIIEKIEKEEKYESLLETAVQNILKQEMPPEENFEFDIENLNFGHEEEDNEEYEGWSD